MSKTFLLNNKIGIASRSGTTTTCSSSASVSGTVIDTQGWTGVVFLITSASANATASCVWNVRGAATSASCAAGTSVDLSGTAITLTAGGSAQMFALEVHKPLQRYLQLYAYRNVSASTFTANYILYGPHGFASQNIGNDINTTAQSIGDLNTASGGTISYELHVSPAVGTA